MLETQQALARREALRAVVDALPDLESSLTIARIPITGAQWCRSVADADVEKRLSKYEAERLRLTTVLGDADHDLARDLRPAAINAVNAASEVCNAFQVLAAFHPGSSGAAMSAERVRCLVAEDIHALFLAASAGSQPAPLPAWPGFPDVSDVEDRDVLATVFGLSAEELTDDEGAFCDTRVIAGYRQRLSQLEQRCNLIMEVIAERPPSLFTAVSAVRDLVTSASPWVTLWCARQVRARFLDAFDVDPLLTSNVLAEAAREGDEEWMAFERLQKCLRSAERAQEASGTDREHAVAVLEAYRHMAEGITKRWVQVLLRLSGLEEPPSTVGTLGPLVAARLGEIGMRVERGLIPVMRNAEAHDDFSFDEDSGLLVLDDRSVDPDEIVAHLTDLDTLQRAFIIGRLAAFADQPGLGGDMPSNPMDHSSASSALVSARQRFGHAGVRVRRFNRDRDRLDIVIDTLKAEACNPCFVALTQAAQILPPTVARFSVRVIGHDDPVIDLPRSVLQENWKVFVLAAKWFPDALPQETFLPCQTWSRLTCESIEDAAQASAWLVLNGGCHAILNVEADRAQLQRLPCRFGTLVAAASSTMRLLPEGPHLDLLERAQRLIFAAGNVYARDPLGIATEILVDRIFGLRDAIGGPVAVLPTLDPTPLREGSYPHAVS